MRTILIISGCLLLFLSANAQKWQPGYFYDKKGGKNEGLIRQDPRGKGPIKDEAFIEYKESEKDPAIKLSASDMRSYVAGRDSFIVAASLTDDWAKEQLDFIRVAVNAPISLFVAKVGNINNRGRGIGISPTIGAGMGTGGYGSGVGGGLAVNIGGNGNRGNRIVYFYGENTSRMQPITNKNFVDVMSEVMGDEPDAVERIRNNKYNLSNIESLIAYFNQLRSSRPN